MKPTIALLLTMLLLFSCRNSSDDQRMEQIINQADSLNKNGHPMTSDSLLVMACEYYDRFGTPNEQLRAHYLLGCVYRDRGEAPHAIDCFKEAINKADTTASDCDFHIMGCVYSQMGDTYHQQLLFSLETEARKKAQYYAVLAGDSIYSIWENVLIAGSYIQQNTPDTAEVLLRKAINLFQQYNCPQEALQASEVLMYLYSEKPERLADLKLLLDDHEANSLSYDDHHELLPHKRQIYYYKGKYFEHIGLLDSAEYYFRKIQHPHMSYSEMVAKNKGLFQIFSKRQNTDSIAKYAELYCLANDSSNIATDQELTARMAASYNYNNFQRIAFEREREADKVRVHLGISLTALIAISVIAVIFIHRSKERHKQKIKELNNEYANAIVSYNKNLQTLQLFDETRKIVIDEIQQELSSAHHKSNEYRDKANQIRQAYSELYEKYEAERAELADENEHLKQKIHELQRQKDIASNQEQTSLYIEEPIVKRIYALIAKPTTPLTIEEKELLLRTTEKYYPVFLHDIKETINIQQSGFYVCILTALHLRSGDIANLLDISFQQVSNIKQQANLALFNDNSARTLYKNLTLKYGINIY